MKSLYINTESKAAVVLHSPAVFTFNGKLKLPVTWIMMISEPESSAKSGSEFPHI